jgi:prephenate dehydratase
MARIRKVDYFVVQVRNRPGEGAKLLKGLKKHGVGLLAFTAFPEGSGAQADFIPEDSREFLAATRALGWKVHSRKTGFLMQGKDRTGALAGLLGKLGKAGINLTAMDAVTAGKRRFGAIFWVQPVDVAKTARLLGAKV